MGDMAGKEVASPPVVDEKEVVQGAQDDDDSNYVGLQANLVLAAHLPQHDCEQSTSFVHRPRQRIGPITRRYRTVVVTVVAILLGAAIIGGSIGSVRRNKNDVGGVQADPATTRRTSSLNAGRTTLETVTAASSLPPTTTVPLSSSVFTTPSRTSSSTTPTGLKGSYNCPADNNTTYISPLLGVATWTIRCGTDWPPGAPTLGGGVVVSKTAGIAYSVEACIDQCVEYTRAGGSCGAVVYNADISIALIPDGSSGNCFLKVTRGLEDYTDHGGQIEAAYLTS